MIEMIWAMDENWLIGQDNILPWHYPKDLAYFKAQTKDKTVLMGDLTYQSLKGYYKAKPLPFKKIYVANIVDKNYPDAILVKDLISFFGETTEDIMVIGGKTIYQLALPYAKRLYVTHILRSHSGNVYFPQFDLSKYRLVSKMMHDALIFAVYEVNV